MGVRPAPSRASSTRTAAASSALRRNPNWRRVEGTAPTTTVTTTGAAAVRLPLRALLEPQQPARSGRCSRRHKAMPGPTPRRAGRSSRPGVRGRRSTRARRPVAASSSMRLRAACHASRAMGAYGCRSSGRKHGACVLEQACALSERRASLPPDLPRPTVLSLHPKRAHESSHAHVCVWGGRAYAYACTPAAAWGERGGAEGRMCASPSHWPFPCGCPPA